MIQRPITQFALVLGLLLAAGCAKSPDTSTTGIGTQLNITLTVAGQINPSDYYYIIFNNINDQSGAAGPVPVIAPPWGNGFVAGAATSYMSFHGNQGQDGYQLFAFQPGTSLQTSLQAGTPTQDTPITAGSNTLQFRIPLADLATSTVSSAQTNYLQINFITTDYIPVNPQDTSPKEFDALGDPTAGHLNSYITIPTNVSNTFVNPGAGNPNYEPMNDVQVTNGSGGYSTISNPNLDIVNYSIQVLH